MKGLMSSRVKVFLGLVVTVLFIISSPVRADVKLPNVIDSNMVLQRDMTVPIWGWADAGEQVTVKLGEQEVNTTADAKGNWTVKLASMKAGGPYEMIIKGKNTIKLAGILVGEVWLCSGQSNMEMGVNSSNDAEKETAGADWPKIRLFHVSKQTSGQPTPDLKVKGVWRICSPKSIGMTDGWGGFSAAGYYFGRELHKKLNVPIGLISSPWGGTRIEPWTPPVGFESNPKLKNIVDYIDQSNKNYRMLLPSKLNELEAWTKAARKSLADNEPIPPQPSWPKHPLDSEGVATGLYNAMIYPLVPSAIRGAIWYQGESNLGDGEMYYEKMKALISGWRKVWGEGDFPFYFVQLAPYKYKSAWKRATTFELPEMWEAQIASLSIPNTGMAATMDISNLDDIHPKNKQDVGKRLAFLALAKTYGCKDMVYTGPTYKSMSVEGGKIRVRFDNIGSGLASRDGKELKWFEVAGEDKKFVEAQAKIDGDTLLVWSDSVSKPSAVRFGWHEMAEVNLMNKEGLPALPFRTEKW